MQSQKVMTPQHLRPNVDIITPRNFTKKELKSGMVQKRPEKMAKTAIISVSDKTGIAEFAKELQKLGIKIISTGNTYKLLKENKINAVQVSDVTKFPEMLDGRVKSLHPNIFAGVLADRSKKSHLSDLKKLKINGIDLVVVNFYPFEESARKKAP